MVAALTAARVVTPAGVVAPGVVEVDRGRITAIASARGPVPDRTLVPGFVDLQVNGVADVDVTTAEGDAWTRLDQLLLAQGVTAWCPTLVTMPLADYAAPLARITTAARRPGLRPRVIGVHLEGPFLGCMPGAHREDLIVDPDPDWLAELPDVVRLVTLGPEAPGAVDAVQLLAERGVLVALGHSAATFEEATAAADAGARLVTHCFNAMPPLHHRQPGLVGAALADDRLAVSLIADLVHVHAAALRTAIRAKGPGGVVLVTDAVAWKAPEHAGHRIRFDGRAARLADGTLAGSALTMDRAVANLVRNCGIPLEWAVHSAATTPADLVGLSDRGRLAPGAVADVVALDADLGVEAVWLAGEQVR